MIELIIKTFDGQPVNFCKVIGGRETTISHKEFKRIRNRGIFASVRVEAV